MLFYMLKNLNKMLTLTSNSLAVVRLQMQLRQLDFYNGLIDGFYDETMRNAVIEFQKQFVTKFFHQ